MSIEVVQKVKADLERAGVDLSGPCGGFQITKRAAWRLRKSGAGLLSKPAGNNCDGFSVDYIVFQESFGVRGVDCLGDAGGENRPQWSDNGVDPALAGRWVAPSYPGDLFPAEPDDDDELPSQPGQPAPGQPQAGDLEARLSDLEERVASLLSTLAALSSEVSNTHAAVSAAVSAAQFAGNAANDAATAAAGAFKPPSVVRGRLFGYAFEVPVVQK